MEYNETMNHVVIDVKSNESRNIDMAVTSSASIYVHRNFLFSFKRYHHPGKFGTQFFSHPV